MTVAISNLTATWSNTSIIYTAIGMNVGITGASSSSKILELRTGGTTGPYSSQFNVSVEGVASDSKGDLRDLPIVNKTASYILSALDTGKTISITTGNVFVTTSVFSSGKAVSIYNNSSGTITITQNSGVTIYLSGQGTTGNRYVSQRGFVTLLCVSPNTFISIGSGLT